MLPAQNPLPLEDLQDVPPVSPWCQRWRRGRHSWRHVRDGGFDRRDYSVDVIPDEEPAKSFVLTHHYAHSWPSASMQFGLYDVSGIRRRLCGVAVFGVPVSKAVLTRPFPTLRPYTQALVCSRFVLLDACPANAESFFLARCMDALLNEGVRGVVSFADPVPRRTASGQLVMPGHVGTIYQAYAGSDMSLLASSGANERNRSAWVAGVLHTSRAASAACRQRCTGRTTGTTPT
ncbi:Mom family adenine methylcarbamoylation protein [Streptomyces chartreusis]